MNFEIIFSYWALINLIQYNTIYTIIYVLFMFLAKYVDFFTEKSFLFLSSLRCFLEFVIKTVKNIIKYHERYKWFELSKILHLIVRWACLANVNMGYWNKWCTHWAFISNGGKRIARADVRIDIEIFLSVLWSDLGKQISASGNISMPRRCLLHNTATRV